jgi:S1-C subfamily serine protease
MKAQFNFLSGVRAGQTDVLGQEFITIGRHPNCDLRFDAESDLDVSGRHASVTLTGRLFVLRDLGSTNGTFVNGQRLVDDHVLASNDLIQFGLHGPRLQFTLIGDGPIVATPAPGKQTGGVAQQNTPPEAASVAGTALFPSNNPSPPRRTRESPPPAPQRAPGANAAAASATAAGAPKPGGGTTTRVRAEVRRQTTTLRRTTVILVLLLFGVTGAYFWQGASTAQKLEEQRRGMLGQLDSLTRQIGSMSANATLMQAALDTARTTAALLRNQIATGGRDPAAIADLRRQLDAAIRRQRNMSVAAGIDAAAISKANQDAVAMVFVQYANGRTYTGSAFGVRTDLNGGLLITNKHVVTDSSGAAAVKVGLVFNGSNQNFKADVVSISDAADLALLRVTVHKGIPVVKGIAAPDSAVRVGDPVAVLGFPFGPDLAGGSDWHYQGVAATLTLGTASRVIGDVLQLDSYGAQGASGSPIFDRSGNVVGVLYGGEAGSNGRIVYGVPVRLVSQLIGGQ